MSSYFQAERSHVLNVKKKKKAMKTAMKDSYQEQKTPAN